ncbi:MAG: hypothetical protein ACPGVC_04905 [Salibacteraceae bacterium]
MKNYFLPVWISCITLSSFGQTENNSKGLGFALNTSVNGELSPVKLVPSVVYFKNKNQFELGVGFNPFGRYSQKLISTEFNYKYFPNGYDKKFNMFLIAHASYVKSIGSTYYTTIYHYIFLTGGYGFELKPFKNAYIGTNVSLGAFTYGKQSEIPYQAFQSQRLFEELGTTLSFQLSFGYRLVQSNL